MRIRLDLAYDGREFSGWAKQPGLRTVEGVLSEALERILRRPVLLTVAGRTDAGVHAAGQVVSLDLDEVPPLRRLNAVLPDDLVVRAVAEAPPEFDARFAATGRAYRYRVTDGAPDPLRRYDTLAWARPLDVPQMREAAADLVGEHDFAAYCRRREGATTVRHLRRLDVARDGDVVTASLEADAFCHSMVRALIGALLAVGEGRLPVHLPGEVLHGGVRDGRLPVAPAHGLTLVGVDYPSDAAGFAARVQESRRLRVPWRVGVAEDAPAVLALLDEAVAWLGARGREAQWGVEPMSGRPRQIAEVERALAAGEARVATDGGEVVGAVSVTATAPAYVAAATEPERYVRTLVTSRSRAPRGLGRELVMRVADEARAAGVGLVRLDCFRSADRALIGVYERMGFEAAGEFEVEGWPGQVMALRV